MTNSNVREKAIFSTFSGVTFSNLAVNLSTLAVMAVAPLRMEIDNFASLSLASSSAMVISGLADLGLNTTIVKKFSHSKADVFLDILLTIKGLLFALGLLSILLSAVTSGPVTFWLLAFAAGSALNYWTGLRAVEQAQQKYAALIASNLRFAVTRALLGFAAISTGSWKLALVAVYVVPSAFAAISTLSHSVLKLRSLTQAKVKEVFNYSKIVFTSSACFVALPYMPQYFVHLRLSATDVATYGLILTFIGPVGLVSYSVRTVLLPKVCGNSRLYAFQIGFNMFTAKLVAILFVLCSLLVAVAFGMKIAYGHRYPDLFWGFILFSVPYLLTSTLGFFNIQVHALDVPHLEMKINILRLITLAGLLAGWGNSFCAVVVIASSTILITEVFLTYAVWRTRNAVLVGDGA